MSSAPRLAAPEAPTLSDVGERESFHQGVSLVGFNRVIQTNRFSCRILRNGVKMRVFVEDLEVGDVVLAFPYRRSSWFWVANSEFKRIFDLGILEESKVDMLGSYFDLWRNSYISRYMRLCRGFNEFVFIKQFSRFDESYRGFIRRKLRLCNSMLWDLKIELTVDPKKCMRYYDEFFLLEKGWNRLNSWFKRRFKDVEFSYFKVLEIQKSGRPHFHVLISGIKWIDEAELSTLWDSYGCGKVVYIKSVSNRDNLKMSSYVMKYVKKTLNGSDRRYSGVLFASNRRLFSMDKHCASMVNVGRVDKEPQGFVFDGSVVESELISFCDEMGIEIKAFMRIEVDFPSFHRFPILFGCDLGG